MAVKGNTSKRYPNSGQYDEGIGKIAENHINNKGNPHGVTAEQIGAAEKGHGHELAGYKTIQISLIGITTGGSGSEVNFITDTTITESALGTYQVDYQGEAKLKVNCVSNNAGMFEVGFYIDNVLMTSDDNYNFEWSGVIEQGIKIVLYDGTVTFEQFDGVGYKSGFMSPEMLAMLLSAVSKEALDKILESYYDASDIKAGYYDRTEVNALIDGVRVIVDREYNKDSGNAQSGKAVAQAIAEEVAKIINSSPEALNTLSELAKALGNDPNFATTVMTEIGKKANSADVYSKVVMDGKLSGKVDVGAVLTPSETEAMFLRYNSQVNKEVDHKIAVSEANIDKKNADNQTVVSGLKDAAESAASEAKEAKASAETAATNAQTLVDQANARLDNVYDKEVMDEALGKKANSNEVYPKSQTFSKDEIVKAIADAVAGLVDSSPETLDTLKEVAAALGDDPNFATTIMTLLDEKANSKDVYTTAQTDAAISEAIKGKASSADVAAALEKKADAENVYSKDEASELLSKKADKSEAANAIKGNAGGEIVAIDDVSPVEHNISVKLRSENLLPVPYYETSKELGGVTFTAQDDGGILLSGTPTEYTYLRLYNGAALEKEKPITVSLTGEFTNAVFDFVLLNASGIAIAAFSSTTGDGNVRTINTKDYPMATRWTLTIKREKNDVETTGVVYPKIEIGEVVTPYKPWVDVSGVKVTRCGDNLLPYPYYHTTRTSSGVTFTDNGDGSITLNGTAEANNAAGFYFIRGIPFNFKDGVTYYAPDFSDKGLSLIILYFDENGTSVYGRNAVTWKKEYEFQLIWLSVSKAGTTLTNEVIYPYLSVREDAKYEKYEGEVFEVDAETNTVEIPALYPTTTLFTDIDGAVIDAEYNKDLNRAFGDIDSALDAVLDAVLAIQDSLIGDYVAEEAATVDEGGDVV